LHPNSKESFSAVERILKMVSTSAPTAGEAADDGESGLLRLLLRDLEGVEEGRIDFIMSGKIHHRCT
jgi:hypothetical protein